VAISQHGTSVLFTSHPKDGLVVNLYIPHNRRMPFQAEEALGLVTGLWFSPGPPVSPTNKTDRHDITETIMARTAPLKAYEYLQ
jgi:hypothetical protein